MKGERGDERTSEVMLQASTREWTIGKDVPRTLSLETFNSVVWHHFTYCRSAFANRRPPHFRRCTLHGLRQQHERPVLQRRVFPLLPNRVDCVFPRHDSLLEYPSDLLLWYKWGFVHVRCGRRREKVVEDVLLNSRELMPGSGRPKGSKSITAPEDRPHRLGRPPGTGHLQRAKVLADTSQPEKRPIGCPPNLTRPAVSGDSRRFNLVCF